MVALAARRPRDAVRGPRRRRCARRACRRSRPCARARCSHGRKRLGPIAGARAVRDRDCAARVRRLSAGLGAGSACSRSRSARSSACSAWPAFAPRLVTGLAPRRRLPGARRSAAPPASSRREQRRPEPGAHGVDRRRADDRPRARLVRRRARQGPARLGRRGALHEQVSADYVVSSQNGWSALHGGGGRRGRGDARRRARRRASARDRGRRARTRARRSTASTRATIAGRLQLRVEAGLRRAALATLGDDGAIVEAVVRERARPRTWATRSRCGRRPGKTMRPDVAGHLRAAERCRARSAAIVVSQQAFDRDFARPSNQLTLVDGATTPGRSSSGAGRVPGREGRDTRREYVDERSRRIIDDDPEPALRAARAVGDREPVRNGQHARALGLRADARARDAARGRHDAAADPPDGAARERRSRR